MIHVLLMGRCDTLPQPLLAAVNPGITARYVRSVVISIRSERFSEPSVRFHRPVLVLVVCLVHVFVLETVQHPAQGDTNMMRRDHVVRIWTTRTGVSKTGEPGVITSTGELGVSTRMLVSKGSKKIDVWSFSKGHHVSDTGSRTPG
ncbi:hypothetical protein BR93DRAFT_625718 [Coniochaeta sp. PMI_546]|nr:hypothetical protein BR93DRAFT_625718 [Coniochaeta sp. PMI_546]